MPVWRPETHSQELEDQVNVQDISPAVLTVTETAVLPPGDDVTSRHLMPEAFERMALLKVDAALVEHVPSDDVGVSPRPPAATKTAHSLATPTTSPALAPASALSLTLRYLGMAIAARMPTMATTIISSISVKPLARPLRCRRVRSSSSLNLLVMIPFLFNTTTVSCEPWFVNPIGLF